MALKTMLEATQDVVSGNQVVHAAATLYASMADVPEGVPVRSVLADDGDDGRPKASPPQVPADAAKAAAEAPAPKGGAKK
jgi:hypothetical protein